MEGKEIIEKLLNSKAEKDNVIDLNAYASGLTDMYNELQSELEKAKELLKVIKSIDRGVLFMQLPSETRESITTFLEGSGNKTK